jgi:hypothetical protein
MRDASRIIVSFIYDQDGILAVKNNDISALELLPICNDLAWVFAVYRGKLNILECIF